MFRARSRLVSVLLFAALAATGLAACGDDDDDADEAGQPSPTTARVQGSDVVTIEMSDFAYSVSGPLTAGGTLRISNTGQELHMMGIGKLKPGKTLQDVTTALEQAGPGGGGQESPTTTTGASGTTTTARTGATTTTTSAATTTSAPGQGGGQEEDPFAEILDEVGLPGSFMSPGESADLRVPNLQPGTYALLCFFPTEGEQDTPHFAKGMVGELRGVEGTAPPEPTADVTYRLTPGQAVQGPATLTPGRHTIKFEAAAGSDQLEPSLARLNAGTTFAQLDAAFTRLFEGEEPPAKGAAKQLPGQVVFGGFDLEGVTSFYLTVDLRAGNYVVIAEDTDDDERPRPPRETISIRVA